jgi:diguanylate cyclase (GGDEF)-like protein
LAVLGAALLAPPGDASIAAVWFGGAVVVALLVLARLWQQASRIDRLVNRLSAEAGIAAGSRDAAGTIEAAFAAAERRLAAAMRQGDPARRDDPDTGLHSRQTAMRRGRDEITRARRNHHPLAVAVFSLDIGPPSDDPRIRGQQERALRLAAEMAMQGLRAYDTVARWGHDLFLAIIPEAEVENAVTAVERLRSMLADAPAIRAGEVPPAVHGGVAVLQPDDATIAEIAARAERALGRARSGIGAAVQAAPGPRQRPASLTSV